MLSALNRCAVGVVGLVAWLFAVSPVVAQKVPNEDLTLRLAGPSEALRTGGEFEVNVLLDSNVGGIDGWQFGIEHDPAVLEVVEATAGITTRVANNGQPVEYLELDTTPVGGAGVTMGVAINLAVSTTLDAGTGYELLTIRYRVIANPEEVSPCVPIDSSIVLSEELGPNENTRITTRVTVEGLSELPLTEDAAFTVKCPGSLEIVQCQGGTDTVELGWEFSEEPTWDFLFLYRDGELLEMLEPEETSFTDTGVAPGTHRYTLVTFIVEEFGEPTLLFSQCTTTVNPVTLESVDPAVGTWLGNEEISITGTAFTVPASRSLSLFRPGGAIVPLDIVEVLSDTEIVARTRESPGLGLFSLRIETEFGDVELTDAFEYGFIRGEVNSDGILDLSDAIYLLEHVFLGIQDRPRCPDSADANDDGLLDLSDAVVILWYDFNGELVPAAPFPTAGQDPTEDELGCIGDG